MIMKRFAIVLFTLLSLYNPIQADACDCINNVVTSANYTSGCENCITIDLHIKDDGCRLGHVTFTRLDPCLQDELSVVHFSSTDPSCEIEYIKNECHSEDSSCLRSGETCQSSFQINMRSCDRGTSWVKLCHPYAEVVPSTEGIGVIWQGNGRCARFDSDSLVTFKSPCASLCDCTDTSTVIQSTPEPTPPPIKRGLNYTIGAASCSCTWEEDQPPSPPPNVTVPVCFPGSAMHNCCCGKTCPSV